MMYVRHKRRPGAVATYLELHLERGSVRDDTGSDIGVVQGIVNRANALVNPVLAMDEGR